MLVAITGAAGFLGRHVLEALAPEGYALRLLVNRTMPVIPDEVSAEIITGGLEDDAALAELVDGADVLVHAAGLVAATTAEPFYRMNRDATARLMARAKEASVGRVLLVSSLAAREPHLSAYARSKRAGEEVLKASEVRGWDVLRPPAIYGPGDLHLLPMLRLLRRRIALLPAGREAQLSLIYVEDAARVVRDWLRSGRTSQTIYTCDDGTQGGYRWPELLHTGANMLGVSPVYLRPLLWLTRPLATAGLQISRWRGVTPFLTPDKLREAAHPDWSCDHAALQAATGWQPSVTFPEGIAKTVEWYREEGYL